MRPLSNLALVEMGRDVDRERENGVKVEKWRPEQERVAEFYNKEPLMEMDGREQRIAELPGSEVLVVGIKEKDEKGEIEDWEKDKKRFEI